MDTRRERLFSHSCFKRSAAELLQIVPSDSHNICAELTKYLELWYGDQHLCDVYSVQLKARQHHPGKAAGV